MDHQPYEPQNTFATPQTSSMPIAALTLAIIGLVFSFIPIFGTICPAIAVALALLSRGGQMHTEGKSKVALLLGLLGIAICFAVTIFGIVYLATHVDYNELQHQLLNVFENNEQLQNYL